MELWAQELGSGSKHHPVGITGDLIGDVTRAESLLHNHNDSLNRMQNAVFTVLQRGQEILHLLESTAPNTSFLQGSESHIQALLEALHQLQMDLDDAAELRRVSLEIDVQIAHMQVEANQVSFSRQHR